MTSETERTSEEGRRGVVLKILRNLWLTVHFKDHSGLIHATCVSGKIEAEPFKNIQKCTEYDVYPLEGFLKLNGVSLRRKPSRLYSLVPPEQLLESENKNQILGKLKEGDLIKGYIKKVEKLITVSLSPTEDAVVLKKNLSDNFINDIEKKYPVGLLVKGKVLSLKNKRKNKKIELSLKESDTSASSMRLEDLKKGTLIKGVISNVEKFGVFVEILNSKIVGLCPLSQLFNKKLLDEDSLLNSYLEKIGKELDFAVMKVNLETRKVTLTMRGTIQKESDPYNERDHPKGKMKKECEKQVNVTQTDRRDQKKEKNWMDEILDEEHDGEDLEEWSKIFNKNDEILNSDSNTKEEDKNEDIEKEKERLEKETASCPGNSSAWLNLMKFYSKQSYPELVKETGEKALKRIPFESLRDREKIWVALVAAEIEFGNAESFKAALDDCVKHCGAESSYKEIISLLLKKRRFSTANTIYSLLLSKSKQSVSCWVSYGKFLLRHSEKLPSGCVFRKYPLLCAESEPDPGEAEPATKNVKIFLERALSRFEGKKRIEFLTRFAKVEFGLGDRAAARKTFNDLLETFSQNTAVWIVFVDSEIKALTDSNASGIGERKESQNRDSKSLSLDAGRKRCRDIFERALSVGFANKKAKKIFAKYLFFAKRHGDEGESEKIMDKARKYAAERREKSN